MPIRWDPLLVRHLADELHAELAGSRVRALRLDGAERDMVLILRERSLLWRLHPARGWLTFGPAVDPAPSDLHLRTRIRSVSTPPDERLLRFDLVAERGGAGPFELIVELVGNRWNAMVTEGHERTLRHVLVRRERPRPLLVGSRYVPPKPTGRRGADGALTAEAWEDLLGDVLPDDRARTLVRSVAWTSPLNAPTIIGSADGGDPDALVSALRRWGRMVAAERLEPVLLEGERGPQPYPFPLSGTSQRTMDSLLDAFSACAVAAREEGETGVALTIGPDLMRRVEEAVRHHERRFTRLRAELDGLGDAAELRGVGDLLLARFGEIPTGASSVSLRDFEGKEVEVELDPGLAPHENADRYYDRAARIERARARLPGLIDEARTAVERFEALRERAVSSDAEPDEIRAALPKRRAPRSGAPAGPALPYRTFRSSGGLEIRVGRGAKHNDDLTFRHSAPDDAWLHARHTGGAHVVLRWGGDGAPPARDLQEAAVLAALHSRARTSGSVPVDWTLRKYVRKPRGSGPGKVVADRVKTIFVEPRQEVAERLAEE